MTGSLILLAGCQTVYQVPYLPQIGGTLPAKVQVGSIQVAQDAKGMPAVLKNVTNVYQTALTTELDNMNALSSNGKCTLEAEVNAYDFSRQGLNGTSLDVGVTYDLKAGGQSVYRQPFASNNAWSGGDPSPSDYRRPITDTIRKLVRSPGFTAALQKHC